MCLTGLKLVYKADTSLRYSQYLQQFARSEVRPPAQRPATQAQSPQLPLLHHVTSRQSIIAKRTYTISYRRKTALQGGLVMAEREDWNWETIFTDIIGLYSTTVTYLASKAIEFREKRKIRAITPFKVIQGHRGRYQSKARMRLPISD